MQEWHKAQLVSKWACFHKLNKVWYYLRTMIADFTMFGKVNMKYLKHIYVYAKNCPETRML